MNNITINLHGLKGYSRLQEHIKAGMSSIIDRFFGDNLWVGKVDITKYNHKNSHYAFDCQIHAVKKDNHEILLRSDSSESDPYLSFNNALHKLESQLRKHHKLVQSYRKKEALRSFDVEKAVIEISIEDFQPEIQSEEKIVTDISGNLNIINEKTTTIKTFTLEEAIMEMDLANLPALVFVNKDTGKLDFVYYRKDGNISLIRSVGNPNN